MDHAIHYFQDRTDYGSYDPLFPGLHSEIIDVVRGSVDSTCYAGIRTNKKKQSAL